ncbi:hypothetical protein HPP92_018865 [Vanilla planifolia]|uniref:EF-hand domain-containing protein n=1 Tax=Vanilla planifolia TaxID=51239 RepID=A0A835Q6I3_VANPL|nr:hypothetical protein HPP92_018865 [Vanilla planifolia]
MAVKESPLGGAMERVMSRLDADSDGKISATELRDCVRASGEEMTAEEAEEALKAIDSDGDGLLGLEDLMKLEAGEEEKTECLRKAFRVYEMKGEGCITATSLREALGNMGERRTAEECEVMIRTFDIDGNGVLSFEEFTAMML